MEDTSPIILESRSDASAAAKKLILGATQSVYLITQRLEAELYNDSDIYHHLSQLTSVNRKTDVRIISHDTRVAANQGHSLIHLCQKFPSFAQIRTTVTPAHRRFRESWLIVDDCSYLRLRNPERYDGYYEVDNRLECRTYLDRFNEMWEAAEPDQNTRRLTL